MPYSGMESFAERITEECVRKWAAELNPHSKNYVYYFLMSLEWAKAKGYWNSAREMLSDHAKLRRSEEENEQYKHVDILSKYVKAKGTGSSDRRQSWHAVASFYAYHRKPLPPLSRNESAKLFKPSESDAKRAVEQQPLQTEEVRQLILNAPMPYKAAFAVMFQGGMGLAEFTQFNANWQSIAKKIDEPGSLKIDLYRSKTSRKSVSRFYTFISNDAKSLIKNWLQMRPTSKDPHLFLTFRKNDEKWVPVGPRNIGDNVILTARKAGLIKRPEASSSANRYHVHPHEFRDLFKSLCQLNGVLPVASEYFLGHSIDRLGYDKSPEYDVEFFRREYRKVEPFLNIISQREGINENAVKATFNRQFLEMAGYSEDEITQMGDLSQIAAQEIQELVQKKSMQALGLNGNSKQRVVPFGEVKNWIGDGWEFVTALPTEEAVMRLPKA